MNAALLTIREIAEDMPYLMARASNEGRETGQILAKETRESLETAIAALKALEAGEGASLPTHRHKKRGSEYVLIGYGRMQAEGWVTGVADLRGPVDMREVAIYRSVADGSLWVRPREEFEDGRFEEFEDGRFEEIESPARQGTPNPAREEAEALLGEYIELNMSNYTDDEVSRLNDFGINAYAFIARHHLGEKP